MELAPPAVSPDAYTEEYYRHHCGPHADWSAREGAELSPYYRGAIAYRVDLQPGERLVDLGAGRGELLAAAVHAGAASAVGIEYAQAAIDLAEATLRAQGVADRARIQLGDVRATGLPGGTADVVTLLDVVEHLAPAELAATFAEARRLLRPGGRVVVHTLPNRLLYDVTYRLQRLAHPRWPRNPRAALELQMHVNEQTRGSLRRELRRAGFADVSVAYGDWRLNHLDPAVGRLWQRLARNPLTRPLGAADLWATARA
jgi:2-polyprenyl-3-methyl-5-hydroxy-6-metoxy-1,4-benzoquinol methylase